MGILAKAIKNAMESKSSPGEDNSPTQHTTDNEGYGEEEYARQGKSCCGWLCDMRRTVIIMSAIGMLLQAATIGLNRWQIDSAKDDTKNENDKDQLDANQLLTNFRDLHDEGDISEGEFRNIRTVLGDKLSRELNDEGDTG